MKALVTDGDQRSALAVTRSLGRRGVRVLVGEERAPCLASSSRYCAGQVTYPSPYREPEAFQAFLLDFVQRNRVDVIVATSDVTSHSVCLNQDALARSAAMAVPPFAAFEMVADKSAILRSAERCGIPIPRTHVVDGIAGLPSIIDHVEYPAVVKAARSRVLTPRGWLATGVHYAHSKDDLRRLYERTEYLASYRSLIQQRIAGPGVGLFALFDRGELVTAFAHRRLREKPPSGGVSVLCESALVDPRLREHAVRLLGPLGWHGVAMLEYKQDRRSGKHYLIEVNGRFWGSLQLAVDAGVDFPYLSHQLALGARPDAPETYRVGLQSRWLLGDLDHLLSRLFKRQDPRLFDEAPSRLRSMLDFLKCMRPGRHDQVASGDDPRPFLYELRQYVSTISASAAHGAGRRAARTCRRGLRFARPSIPA